MKIKATKWGTRKFNKDNKRKVTFKVKFVNSEGEIKEMDVYGNLNEMEIKELDKLTKEKKLEMNVIEYYEEMGA